MNNAPKHDDHAGDVLDGWMSRPELAETLGITAGTLAKWQNQRTGPPLVRIGRKVMYRRQAVQDWLRSQEGYGNGAGRK